MIKQSLVKALSDQVNEEYYSAYLYLSMSAWADRAGFKGMANWLSVQAREELDHGMRLYRYILERGAAPAFADVKVPPQDFGSVKSLFEKVLAHEQHITGLVSGIASLAQSEGDHAAYSFVSWFVNEQVEEEANVEELIAQIRMIGDNTALLYSLDAKLAGRAFKG